ncbi:MAG: trypsin-like peptidase domain-containing protein [Spirochaetales bacterium]|nr:trypsin-like peptidase domain-containing protein [Spirochaetales bacterium]
MRQLAVLSCLIFFPLAASDFDIARTAVVKIDSTALVHSYQSPWKQPVVQRSGGTGFVIAGQRILTNAHVVSQATILRVKRPDHQRDYLAKVEFIAHDCDLALLRVDEAEFFQGAVPLAIGETPKLQTPVTVIGFPIGGNRESITRGIVSRLGMDVYSHSGVDAHLTIQVDAAINPGNSGGPALYDGKVIGVAFQVYSRGENLGYLIPPDVIGKFLTDIKDGKYDGYIELGVVDMPTENETVRRYYGLEGMPRPMSGVVVRRILPGSSADGQLKVDDVIVALNGQPISESGDIFSDGRLVNYIELIDNVSAGTAIRMTVLRAGKKLDLDFPARRMSLIDFQRMNYENPPEYWITAGLVFQPVDASLMQVYGRKWTQEGRLTQLYRYGYFLSHQLFEEVTHDVALTRRLGDEANLYAESFEGQLVAKVDGVAVKSFKHFVELVARSKGEFLVLHFRDTVRPLVLPRATLASADARVLGRYGIPRQGLVRK